MAKVLISMREEFLEKVDEVADKEQRTRSELIRQAIRTYIRQRRGVKAVPTSKGIIESILLD